MFVKNGFNISYEIKEIRSIKVVPSGEFQGNKYSASVQVTSYNIEQIEDEKYGLVDREVSMVFKILCEDKDLRKFNDFLRNLKGSIKIDGGIPRLQGKDTYIVNSLTSAEDILNKQPSKK